MQVSNQAQAVLLLTSHFTKLDRGEPKPLSTSEWGKLAYWLKDRGLQPDSLLSEDPRRLLSGWMDRGITQDRIEYLLGRGGALGLALEKWERAGLWVLTRSDSEYPERLKKRLKLEAPPVLFGCGKRSLLNGRGIAIVGSRNASDADLSFAAQLGADAASQGFSVVSGGARGIDESAMLGALEREGTVVGVLADSLLRSATSARYRKHLMSNDLVLVSPFNPEAGFNVGNAMARNSYIYCLADAAVVVTTGRDRGGTWSGAIENLRSHWAPLWVRSHPDAGSGNADLVRRGAKWLPNDRSDLPCFLPTRTAASKNSALQGSCRLADRSRRRRKRRIRERWSRTLLRGGSGYGSLGPKSFTTSQRHQLRHLAMN
jgi:predicted Rossmann fold nucleotide-binding protein DprA/Smf involved in DNA uptake